MLIRPGKRWKWLRVYHEVPIVDNIKPHKGAFVLEFLQQFSQYCLCFNLISIYFSLLCRFYWGCACSITPHLNQKWRSGRGRVPLLYWLPLSLCGLIWLSVPDINFFLWYFVLSGYCLSPHSDIHCVFTAKLNILHHFFNILPQWAGCKKGCEKPGPARREYSLCQKFRSDGK